MSQLSDIEKLTTAYGNERQVLSARVAALQHALEEVRAQHIGKIKHALGRCSEKHADLKAAIEAAPELFQKPKTLVINAIRIGFKKGKGKIEFEDEDQVIRLIRKHLTEEQAEILIKVKETVSKAALEQLPAADLKRIGVSLLEAGELTVIQPTDTAVDKIVEALLKEAEGEADERKAAA